MNNTLLLVADFINDITSEKGAFGAVYAEKLKEDKTVENANKLIKWARENKIKVAHVKVGFSDNYQECMPTHPAVQNGVLKLGTWGTEFDSKLDVQKDDLIVVKHRISALYGSNLEPFLRANRIENVIVCGVATDLVVESTVRELGDRDYNVTVVSDACNTSDDQKQAASLNAMSRFAKIQAINEFLA
jgi:nicotinamidase-related amidase